MTHVSKANGPKRLWRDESAVTIVEFAIIAPVLVLLIAGLFELGYVLFARSTLESAILEAARSSRVADCPQENAKVIEADLQNRMNAVVSADGKPAEVTVASYSNEFRQVGNPEPFDDTNGNGERDPGESYTDLNGNGQWDEDLGQSGNFGDFGEVVRFSASYNVRSLLPFVADAINGGKPFYTISAETVVRNEPFMEASCEL